MRRNNRLNDSDKIVVDPDLIVGRFRIDGSVRRRFEIVRVERAEISALRRNLQNQGDFKARSLKIGDANPVHAARKSYAAGGFDRGMLPVVIDHQLVIYPEI